MFWRKKDEGQKIESEEYRRLAAKLADIEASVSGYKAEVRLLQSDCDNLRGQFNRKLKGLAAEEKKEEAKDLNKPEPKVFTGMSLL